MERSIYDPINRVDEMTKQWNTRAKQLIDLHGPDVVHDREFLRARRNTYNNILKNFKPRDLTFDEKISSRIMKGQIRHINRVLYPNRLLRTTRTIILLPLRTIGRALRALGRVLNSMLATMTSTRGIEARKEPNRSLLNSRTAQGPTQDRPVKSARKAPVEQVRQKSKRNTRTIQNRPRTTGPHL